MLFLWIYLMITGKYDEINHTILVSGYSYLPCDRDLAQINKRKRVKNCQVSKDLINLMVVVTPNNPTMITMLKPDNLIDFKQAADLYINTTKLNISKCSQIKIEKKIESLKREQRSMNLKHLQGSQKKRLQLKKLLNTQFYSPLPCHNSQSA